MKAIQFNSYGDTNVLDMNPDAVKPTVTKGQLLVEVHAAGLNRIDSAIRLGAMKENMPLSFPVTTGGDFSGVVREVGEGATGYAVGDEVYGQAGILTGGSGSLAEFVAVSAEKTAKKPVSVDMVQAASLPLVGASAIQALEEHMKIERGWKLLVQGGAGGIGSLAIQIAKLHGAFVTATVSSEDIPFVKSLGADEVIDYKTGDMTKRTREFDGVFVTARAALNESLHAVKEGGILVSMVGPADEAEAQKLKVTVVPQMTRNTSEQFVRLAELVDGGNLKPQIDKIFPFDQTKEAYEYFETKHPNGKVVVEVKK